MENKTANNWTVTITPKKPTWELIGMLPVAMNEVNLRRLEVVLKESDEEYFKKLAAYYRNIRQPKFTPEKYKEAILHLEHDPLRKKLYDLLAELYSRQPIRVFLEKNQVGIWPEMVWPNLENDYGAVCTGTATPSATQVLTDISEIKQKLTHGFIEVKTPYRSDEQLQIAASAPAMKHSPLSEKQHHTLLTKTINEINRFYYEQIDNRRFTGETTFVITCEQTRLDSDMALLGGKVREYFDNIFDPECPHKKFHISTAINHLTSGDLAVFLKWGLHADRANDAENPRIKHIGIEQVVLP